MPFLYKLGVGDSPIHGKGLFALEDIPKGVVYWVYESSCDSVPVLGFDARPNQINRKEDLDAIKDAEKLHSIMRRSFYYADADVLIEGNDGSEFMNHWEDPNSQIVYNEEKDYRKLISVTLRDIKAGEEVVEDYANYVFGHTPWANHYMSTYYPERKALENTYIHRAPAKKST